MFATVAFAVGVGCSATPRAQVEDVHSRTARNGATATDVTEIARSSNGVRFAWDVRISRTWQEYRTEVIETFKPEFEVVRNDATSLVLARLAHGDAYHIELRVVSSSPVVTSHVVFSATAD
jgi:hypothetical protein